MKEYNYLQAIYMSFYSPKLYRDVLRNWGAGAVLYLFILLVICWSITMFKYQASINVVANQAANKYVLQMPELTIKEGQVTTPEKKPYIIKDPSNDKIFAIIDTSGQYKDLQNAPKEAALLVTQDSVYYYEDENDIKVQKIPTTVTMDVKPEQIKNVVVKFAGWAWLLLLPFLIMASFAYRLIQALIYAIFGKILAVLNGIVIPYVQIVKLSLVAVTPAIILGTVLDWFFVVFRFQGLIYFIIAIAYLLFALLANKENAMRSPLA